MLFKLMLALSFLCCFQYGEAYTCCSKYEAVLDEAEGLAATVEQIHIDETGIYLDHHGSLILLSSIQFLDEGIVIAVPDIDGPMWYCRECETFNDPGFIYCYNCGEPY